MNSPAKLNRFKDFVAMVVATAFGSGFAPKAPGTAGTLVALLLVLLWERGLGIDGSRVDAAAFIGTFAIGWWASLRWSRKRRQTDCQEIVIDEVLGYWLSIFLLPHTNAVLAVQFVLFRIFDAWK